MGLGKVSGPINLSNVEQDVKKVVVIECLNYEHDFLCKMIVYIYI